MGHPPLIDPTSSGRVKAMTSKDNINCVSYQYRSVITGSYILAVLLSLGASLAVACHHLFIRIGTDTGRTYNGVYIVMLVNLAILLPIVVFFYYPEYNITVSTVLPFLLAGVFGTLLGRVLMYTSIERIGASRTSPIIASNALFATMLSVVFLDESLTLMRTLGVILVVTGVGLISWETSNKLSATSSPRNLSIGLLIPLLASFAYGLEPIFASFGLSQGTPAPVGAVIRTSVAFLGFTVYLKILDDDTLLNFTWSPSLRWFLLAGVANTVFLIGYYVALNMAPVNLVIPVLMTNPLFVLVLSLIFVSDRLEEVTRELIFAASIVVAGVVLIILFN